MTKEQLFLYTPIVTAKLVSFIEQLSEDLNMEGGLHEVILSAYSSMFVTASPGSHSDEMKSAATILKHTPSLFGLIIQEYTPGENHKERADKIVEVTGEHFDFINKLPLSHLTDEEFEKYLKAYEKAVQPHKNKKS
jgi:hypothetical protein